MGKRRRRRAVVVVEEELDEAEERPSRQQKQRRLPVAPREPELLGEQEPVRRQAGQFLSQLSADLNCRLGDCKVGGGVVCSAYGGSTHELCTNCGHVATLHELEIEACRPLGLGGAAWLLLRARAAVMQLGSFAWSDALIRAAQVAAPEALGAPETLEGGGDTGGSETVQHTSSQEVVRWWRQHSAVTCLVADGEGLESAVRLACEIDALWFRLHYFTATEAPEHLALAGSTPATSNAHGVPTHAEWVARAVGSTIDSSLLGGRHKQSRSILTQAHDLGRGYPHAAGRAGRTTDIDGLELAAVLRRGLAAAKRGSQATLHSWCSSSAAPPDCSGSSSPGLDNELQQVYDCLLVESQLLFQHNKMLYARMAQQWSYLAGEPRSLSVEQREHTGLIQADANPNAAAVISTICAVCANQEESCTSASVHCSFCGSAVCDDTCAAECLSCGRTVCLRCRYQDEVCPRCDFPLCPPLLSLYRDSCRDPACHLMAYAVPSDAALAAIVGLQLPVVECGAGTGYWAKLLRARGVVVAAYDIAPSKTAAELAIARARASAHGLETAGCESVLVGNEYHAEIPAFTTVWQGGAEAACNALAQPDGQAASGAATATSASGFDPSRAALFLCFPPPVSRMASDCLRAYRGSVFLYVGEWQGETGTPKFEKSLCKDWLLCRRLPLPNWGSTSYTLTIWLRKSSVRDLAVSSTGKGVTRSKDAGHVAIPRSLLIGLDLAALTVADDNPTVLLSPMPCAACGKPAKRRCRFCHAVAYCSARCCVDDAPAHGRSHHVRGVFLPPCNPPPEILEGNDGGEHASGGCGARVELGEGAYGSKRQYARLERFVQRR